MVESYKFDSEQAEVTVASRHIEKHSYTSKLGLHHYLHASPQKQDDKMYRSMPARVHTSNLDIESKPQELMTLTCMINNRKFFDIALYRDTSLNWLFSVATAASQTFGYGILKPGLKANLKEHFRYHIQVYLHFLSSGKDYYLLTNAKKTLSELGIHDRDIFQPCQTYGEQPKVEVATKQNNTKSGKKKEKKQKRSVKPKKQPLKQSYNGEETLREIHSKSMEPVLNELRPLMKIRRINIASYYIQNSTSKKKKSSTKVAAKGTKKNDAHIMPTSLNNHLGGKAGKSVYKVVVGETTNLYKTSKFKSLSSHKINTLDLHGCSRYKAMGLLRKNLQEWVDLAMKGEYPFLIPCDIICGGGNQLLSEIVAQFISDSPQVANRRKGI